MLYASCPILNAKLQRISKRSSTIKRKSMLILDTFQKIHPALVSHALRSDAIGVVSHEHVREMGALQYR